MLVWVHGCDPGRVSDSSRLAYTKRSQSSALLLSFSGMCFVLFVYFCLVFVLFLLYFVFMLSLELLRRYSSDLFLSNRTWWLCMAINIGVKYNVGLFPNITLLTQRYYHRGTRSNTMQRPCLYSL